jgi:glycosidase
VQVCYFLLPDRFSDGKESERELFKAERATEFARPKTETKEWAESAMQWQGGSLRGIIGQLAYLKARRTVRLCTVPVL